MKPLPPADGKISQAHTSGIFLEKPGLLKEALKRTEEWDNVVPGASFGQADGLEAHKRESTIEMALLKLKEEKAATAAGGSPVIVDPNDDGRLIVTNTASGASTEAQRIFYSLQASVENNVDDDAEFEEFVSSSSDAEVTLNIQKASEASPGIIKQGESKDPVVVFVRHGRTPHNNLGLFTGWEDPPLAPDGVEDAKMAGRLLKMHGFEFDVVYTSWLTRAIETACELCARVSHTYTTS